MTRIKVRPSLRQRVAANGSVRAHRGQLRNLQGRQRLRYSIADALLTAASRP